MKHIPFSFLWLKYKNHPAINKLMLIIMVMQLPVAGIEAQKIYVTNRGHVSFFSKAPISDVDARNNKVNAKLNTATNELTFDMRMGDFKFKNRKMGRDAEDKYIETEKYPRAGFEGKLIGKINFDKSGTYAATAKGKLNIHGVEKEISEKGTVKVQKGKIRLQSDFHILLKDYNIETPEILGLKMTDEDVLINIDVTLSAAGKNLLLLPAFITCAQQSDTRIRTLIVIFDGLRPDYITPENMPNVHALKKTGAYGLHNHSVFPTVTRVNASSYITGSYPAKHGLMGNTVYFPEVDKTHGLNTGEVADLRRIAEATHDKLLTSVSLGELLQQAGEKMMVFSSGSSGQAFLQNHTVNGGVVHPELIVPASLKEDVIKTLGKPPASVKPNSAQHEWVTRALLHYGFATDGPAVNAIWLSDPDGTAHAEGIGAPLTMESIKIVDLQFGKIIGSLKEKDLFNSVNIIITADHGFATDVGTEGITKFLIAKALKKGNDSEDVVVAGNALYVKDRDPVIIKKIVSALQEQPWVGAIFTKSASGQSAKGWVEGTLSFETIHWDHPTRAADVLVDYNWDNRKNTYGYEGASFANGVAGHGGSSPYEIHIPLIASGPGFKKAYESSIPTSNTDIVPTILQLHGLRVPSEMDGRVLTELFKGTSQKQNERVRKEILETTVKNSWGTYHLLLERSVVGKQHYVNFTRVKRGQR